MLEADLTRFEVMVRVIEKRKSLPFCFVGTFSMYLEAKPDLLRV